MDRTTKRNVIGFLGWTIVALAINMLAIIPMVIREYYQKRKLGIKMVENDDLLRYSIAIVIGSLVQICLIL